MQIICQGSKLWQLLARSVITFHNCLLQAENSMTHNSQKEKLLGFMQAPASAHVKECDENKKEKRLLHKNVIDGRKPLKSTYKNW